MPAQPGMPPLSSTQLQIDSALQEFQLVDLSRRFLVHDSFWALPEQFLGNKVRDPAAIVDKERAEPLVTCPEPAWASLPLELMSSREDSAAGKGVVVPPVQPPVGSSSSSCPPLSRWQECQLSLQKTLPDHLHTWAELRAPPLVSLGSFCIALSYFLLHWTKHPKGPGPTHLCFLCPAPCQAHSEHQVCRVRGRGTTEHTVGIKHVHGCPALICPVLARWTPMVARCATRYAMSCHEARWSQCSGQTWSLWVPDTAYSPEATRPPSPVL